MELNVLALLLGFYQYQFTIFAIQVPIFITEVIDITSFCSDCIQA